MPYQPENSKSSLHFLDLFISKRKKFLKNKNNFIKKVIFDKLKNKNYSFEFISVPDGLDSFEICKIYSFEISGFIYKIDEKDLIIEFGLDFFNLELS